MRKWFGAVMQVHQAGVAKHHVTLTLAAVLDPGSRLGFVVDEARGPVGLAIDETRGFFDHCADDTKMKACADDRRRANGDGHRAAHARPFDDRTSRFAGDFLNPRCIDDVENKWLACRKAAPFGMDVHDVLFLDDADHIPKCNIRLLERDVTGQRGFHLKSMHLSVESSAAVYKEIVWDV